MKIGETEILDTFAEAFGMRYTRLIVTADDDQWLDAAIHEFTGYSSSVIACDMEAGLETRLSPKQTPDGRPGAALLAFSFSAKALGDAIPNRVGQCLMTCPTTAVFDGLQDGTERIALGKHIRYFGDGFQKSKKFLGRRYWRVPVMDGEFLVEESLGVAKGVGGGNIILQARDSRSGAAAARRGASVLADMPGIITPFPGGVVRSGSKVGSIYKTLKASIADAYCPTLKGRTETQLLDGVNCVYEIVMDGVDEATVGHATAETLRAVAGEGVVAIGAGNYGGKLGKFHFRLCELLQDN